MTRCDVLVIGGGPAGASAAAWLARGRRDVLLVEREANAHHKVCGEFVSVEACRYLAALDVDLNTLGAAEVEHVRLGHRDRTTEIDLPFRAKSVSRRAMDEALLQAAERNGARIFRGTQVERLEGRQAVLADGQTIQAKQIFLATGKHDLRGRPRPSGAQGDLIAFKMHWRLSSAQQAALRGFVELLLFTDGYGGLELIEDGMANLCVLVRQRRRERWEDLLQRIANECSLLKEHLAGAEACWPKPVALSHIPYGFVRRQPSDLWCLGDQAAVIPSFAGDGMAIALHSGGLAAEILLRGGTALEFQQQLAEDVGRQVARATLISRLMVAAPTVSMGIARMWPGVMQSLAQRTRIPDERIHKYIVSQ